MSPPGLQSLLLYVSDRMEGGDRGAVCRRRRSAAAAADVAAADAMAVSVLHPFLCLSSSLASRFIL